MLTPGIFAFFKHDPTGLLNWIEKFQPSVVKGFAHLTSGPLWETIGHISPNTIRVVVPGEVTDNPSLSAPEADAERVARLLDSHPGWPRLAITKNELLYKTHPLTYWAQWVDYHARYLRRAQALGLNSVVGEVNSGHWNTYLLDGYDQWSLVSEVDSAMSQGDYWGLHEYWGLEGPLWWWPWTAGRHMTAYTNHNILLDEIGFDIYTDYPEPDMHKRGWRAHLSPEQYFAQLLEFHQLITDSRVKGSSNFLWDFDNSEWQSFNVYDSTIPNMMIARREEFLATHPKARIKSRLTFPLATYVTNPDGSPRITQTFDQHPSPAKGIDISCFEGSPVLAADEGVVDKVIDLGLDSYGKYIQINHRWGFTLYAHLSQFRAEKGSDVRAGSVIGLSGNTGKSTGPHLHFEIKDLSNRVYPHRNNPAPYILPPNGVVPVDLAEKIRNLIWNHISADGVLAYNPKAAFPTKARELKLGAPLTNEHDIEGYRAQGFALGILYAKIGEWGNIHKIDY